MVSVQRPAAELADYDRLPARDAPADGVAVGRDAVVLEYSLPAQMDEFIMTSDVLSEADVAALKEYYKPCNLINKLAKYFYFCRFTVFLRKTCVYESRKV